MHCVLYIILFKCKRHDFTLINNNLYQYIKYHTSYIALDIKRHNMQYTLHIFCLL